METLAIYLDLQKAIKVVTLRVVKYTWPSQQYWYRWTACLVSLQSTPATSRGSIRQSISFSWSKRKESQSPPIFFMLTHLHKSQLHAPAACITPALVLTRPAQPLIEVISQKTNLPNLPPLPGSCIVSCCVGELDWFTGRSNRCWRKRKEETGPRGKENHFSTTSELFHELRYS